MHGPRLRRRALQPGYGVSELLNKWVVIARRKIGWLFELKVETSEKTAVFALLTLRLCAGGTAEKKT